MTMTNGAAKPEASEDAGGAGEVDEGKIYWEKADLCGLSLPAIRAAGPFY